ncbi:family 16 glycosylhydrolase [Streptomyces sp. NPDC102406]|uniref:glycoside hydrolase family 16 protein n=1 Tax=Streptomyces sp. NPDC102406 TaxID=3366171 RepID=UPI00382EAAD6
MRCSSVTLRRSARRLAVAAAVLGLLTACSSPKDSAASHESPGDSGDWRLTWSDEFSGAKGTPPDPRSWVHDLGGEPQWGNDEWQYYTDREANAAADGKGRLVITARRETLPGMDDCPVGTCDITSARLTTKGTFDQTYGRFEARIKVPDGGATLPAFWMMGADDDTTSWPGNGEIDVMEVVGDEPGTVYGTVHGPGYGDEGVGGSHVLPNGEHLARTFHTYGVEWTEDQVTWTLDGRTYHVERRSADHRWVFDHDFYLLLDLAVGGVWPGPVTEDTSLPTSMLVDWVRVYSRS